MLNMKVSEHTNVAQLIRTFNTKEVNVVQYLRSYSKLRDFIENSLDSYRVRLLSAAMRLRSPPVVASQLLVLTGLNVNSLSSTSCMHFISGLRSHLLDLIQKGFPHDGK